MSTNKAPRLFKPGEMAFSQSGSPLLMPRLGTRGKRQETIPVNDADGKVQRNIALLLISFIKLLFFIVENCRGCPLSW
jgi:hypothetical protein